MNDYRVSTEQVPNRLYYVHHGRSQANTMDGIKAQDPTFFHAHNHALYIYKESVEDHLEWTCRKPSPYISLMAHKEHAENFARLMSRKTGRPSQVFHINGKKLNTSYVFEVRHLRKALCLSLKPSAQIDSEFLVLHRVPEKAIIRKIVM
ncbi:hypothetical protein LOZ58_003576 [Ophidiomyces ophidiicola]|nr:hypothetical protein LOZ65_001297 [Ophidiomyces ophidiicola]KAI1941323.1 hypothetical protein LOZ66_001839 [Ophidiomyces ophidiicola]KAI1961088.1 hypothetical protein LOZ58_003576 [Ophidiomyces ophidiicola]